MTAHDLNYYRQRADEERDKAAAASQPFIADIHLDLAAKYDDLVATSGRGLPSELLLRSVPA